MVFVNIRASDVPKKSIFPASLLSLPFPSFLPVTFPLPSLPPSFPGLLAWSHRPLCCYTLLSAAAGAGGVLLKLSSSGFSGCLTPGHTGVFFGLSRAASHQFVEGVVVGEL